MKADERTGAFPVILELPNPDRAGMPRRLRAGMDVTLSFTRTAIADALVVPGGSLLRETDRTYVFLVEGETAFRREVTVGAEAEGAAVIASGLAAGDLLFG